MHAETGATHGACMDHASSGNDPGPASPMLACRKSPIYLHVHENVLARLGSAASKLHADAFMVKSEQAEQETSIYVHIHENVQARFDVKRSSSTLSLHSGAVIPRSVSSKLPADACMVKPAQVELEEEEENSAFEDHLLLAEPTRRSKMTRNNACLDLGVLGRRAATPCLMG